MSDMMLKHVIVDIRSPQQAGEQGEILSTSARPDITIISSDSTTLVELTVPWNSEDNLAQAKRRKSEKLSLSTCSI